TIIFFICQAFYKTFFSIYLYKLFNVNIPCRHFFVNSQDDIYFGVWRGIFVDYVEIVDFSMIEAGPGEVFVDVAKFEAAPASG
ncbi:MAG: hypothetical protein Q4B73_06920, partial [Lachnospiraceae bacterium]|nr:hypothetical protein [Lachnospiraceae bacterium]